MIRNPSEYMRLMEEREYHLIHIRSEFSSKSTKEYHLAELRKIDATLEIDSGDYNSPGFGKIREIKK